jgi:hypothetical protein
MNILEKSNYRAKTNLKREIWANVGKWGEEFPKFVTFTQGAENWISELGPANYEMRKGIQRLEYYVGHKLHYTAVVQFQKRGAVHHHVLFYDLPFIDAHKLREIWGRGFVKINAIDDIMNTARYVSSYMGKDMHGEPDARFWAKKRYFSSKGLFKPIEKRYKRLDDMPTITDTKLEYEADFWNEYAGAVNYQLFNLSKVSELTHPEQSEGPGAGRGGARKLDTDPDHGEQHSGGS